MCFCFCQAEDGIRDYKVTGVQTCALPIWFSERCRRPGSGGPCTCTPTAASGRRTRRAAGAHDAPARPDCTASRRGDRKRGVLGKRENFGGVRFIKKKKYI